MPCGAAADRGSCVLVGYDTARSQAPWLVLTSPKQRQSERRAKSTRRQRGHLPPPGRPWALASAAAAAHDPLWHRACSAGLGEGAQRAMPDSSGVGGCLLGWERSDYLSVGLSAVAGSGRESLGRRPPDEGVKAYSAYFSGMSWRFVCGSKFPIANKEGGCYSRSSQVACTLWSRIKRAWQQKNSVSFDSSDCARACSKEGICRQAVCLSERVLIAASWAT